jgi:hypothetical protein
MVVRGSRNGIEVEFIYTVLENLENNVLYLKNASINNLKVHMIRESF